MSNKITVFQGNSNTVICTIAGLVDLIGYTAQLTVKADARDSAPLMEADHSDITGLVITFDTTPVHNTLDARDYIYEIVITDGTNIYSVTQDVYEVLESVKY